jgi:hypothetical protein
VSHNGVDGEALWLSCGKEASVGFGEAVVASDGSQRCSEKRRPDLASAACGGSVAVRCSAIAWMRGAGGQACGPPAVDMAEFGHDGDKRGRQDRADTGNGAQDGLPGLQLPAPGNEHLDLLFDVCNALVEVAYMASDRLDDRLVARRGQPVGFLHPHGDEVGAAGNEQFDHRLLRFGCLPARQITVAFAAVSGKKKKAGVDRIGLGSGAGGSDEGFDLGGIGAMGGDGKGLKDTQQRIFVSACGLADGKQVVASGIGLEGSTQGKCLVCDGDGLSGVAGKDGDGPARHVAAERELDFIGMCGHDGAPCLALSAGAASAGPFKSTSDAKLVRRRPMMRSVDKTHSCSGAPPHDPRGGHPGDHPRFPMSKAQIRQTIPVLVTGI